MSGTEVEDNLADPEEREAWGTEGNARLFWLVLAVVGVAVSLFDWFSIRSRWAARGMDGRSAPIYGFYRPHFSSMDWLGAAVALVAALVAVAVVRRTNMRPVTAVTIGVAILLAFSMTLAVSRADRMGLPGRTLRSQPIEYQGDVALVKRIGPGAFVHHFSHVVPDLRSHAITHPPAALLLLYMLEKLFPAHLVPRALVLGSLSALVVSSTWFLARSASSGENAVVAAMLVATAPGLAIFAFTAMDAVYATVLSAVAVPFVVAQRKGNSASAFIAGLLVGLASFISYAVSFIAAFGLLWIAIGRRPAKNTLLLIGWVLIGGALAVALLHLAGFDLISSYRAFKAHVYFSPFQLTRPQRYWFLGQWAAWLTYLGLPLAGCVIYGLFSRQRNILIAALLPVAVFYALPRAFTGLLPGETERTWLFLIPFVAVSAALALKRIVPARHRPWAIGALVLVAGIQAVVLNSLFLNLY